MVVADNDDPWLLISIRFQKYCQPWLTIVIINFVMILIHGYQPFFISSGKLLFRLPRQAVWKAAVRHMEVGPTIQTQNGQSFTS